MNVTVSGVEEVVRELKRRGLNVTNALSLICMAGAMVLKEEIAGNAPGSIASSIVAEKKKNVRGRVLIHIGPSKEVFYARFVEYGTNPHLIPFGAINGTFVKNINHPGATARPFVRPGFDNGVAGAQREIANKTREALRK